MKKIRVNLELDKATYNAILKAQKQMNAASITETVRRVFEQSHEARIAAIERRLEK